MSQLRKVLFTEILNLKKGIAASFQANFKKTEAEQEVDAQSTHISHYRYEIRLSHAIHMVLVKNL